MSNFSFFLRERYGGGDGGEGMTCLGGVGAEGGTGDVFRYRSSALANNSMVVTFMEYYTSDFPCAVYRVCRLRRGRGSDFGGGLFRLR